MAFTTVMLVMGLVSGLIAQQRSEQQWNQQQQQMQTQRQNSQQQSSQQQRTGQLNLTRANQLMGADVKNQKGEKLGTVNDVVLDSQHSKISYLAISHGGFLGIGDKLFAVPMEAFKTQQKDGDLVLILDAEKQQFEQAEGFSQDSWPQQGDQRWARGATPASSSETYGFENGENGENGNGWRDRNGQLQQQQNNGDLYYYQDERSQSSQYQDDFPRNSHSQQRDARFQGQNGVYGYDQQQSQQQPRFQQQQQQQQPYAYDRRYSTQDDARIYGYDSRENGARIQSREREDGDRAPVYGFEPRYQRDEARNGRHIYGQDPRQQRWTRLDKSWEDDEVYGYDSDEKKKDDSDVYMYREGDDRGTYGYESDRGSWDRIERDEARRLEGAGDSDSYGYYNGRYETLPQYTQQQTDSRQQYGYDPRYDRRQTQQSDRFQQQRYQQDRVQQQPQQRWDSRQQSGYDPRYDRRDMQQQDRFQQQRSQQDRFQQQPQQRWDTRQQSGYDPRYDQRDMMQQDRSQQDRFQQQRYQQDRFQQQPQQRWETREQSGYDPRYDRRDMQQQDRFQQQRYQQDRFQQQPQQRWETREQSGYDPRYDRRQMQQQNWSRQPQGTYGYGGSGSSMSPQEFEQRWQAADDEAADLDSRESSNGTFGYANGSENGQRMAAIGAANVNDRRLSRLTGRAVHNPSDNDLGDIEDVIIDMTSGRVIFGLISYGGFLGIGDDVAIVPWEAINLQPQQDFALLDTTQERMAQFKFEDGQLQRLADRNYAERIFTHYDTQPDWQAYGFQNGAAGQEPMSPQQGTQRQPGTQTQQQQMQGAWAPDSEFNRKFTAREVQTLEGEVQTIGSFRPDSDAAAGLRLRIRTEDDRTATVYAGPHSYMLRQGLQLRTGDDITVRGSKATVNGREVLLASSIEADDKTIEIRDQQGKPKWTAQDLQKPTQQRMSPQPRQQDMQRQQQDAQRRQQEWQRQQDMQRQEQNGMQR